MIARPPRKNKLSIEESVRSADGLVRETLVCGLKLADRLSALRFLAG